MTAELVTWVDVPDADRVRATIRTWDEPAWRLAETVALVQGIGPYLHDTLPRTPIYAALPDSFRGWLAAQYEMNGARVRRLHEDLVAILRQANRVGIGVMPLKGSLLTTRYYPSPALRPMADLDLLVRPTDEAGLASVLEKLGYRSKVSISYHPGEREFVAGGGERIVSSRDDHPDNPRPVEVHTNLRKYLWVEYGCYDLTEFIWAGSRETEILGERVWVPALDRFLVYVATHAMYHHLFRSGRLIHLLDLAYFAAQAPTLDPPDANWVYPPLRLAARVWPSRFAAIDLSGLALRTQPRLRRWAESVPLDGRCGLSINLTPPPRQTRRWLRWLRWHPSSPRLALAFPRTPLLLAYGRHLLMVARYLGKRAAAP